MKSLKLIGVAALASALTLPVFAYQVTGPVVEVTDKSITVKKGDENWKIAKDANTKTMGDVKVGEKVTVMYGMNASSIEVKEDKKADKKAKK